ncbi:MAG TPA: ERCC4 domain-containing protein [Candidatus Nanopelagicaceae bacterium]|nr:ERCC4 domain-containing protein [Candidatus Nanopelagicaceae bacterium]
MSKPSILEIIIDNREKKLMKLLEENHPNIHFQAKQLDIADIVITEDVAIERKEGFDFVSSIMDNRLFEQCLRLKETYSMPILVLEGLNDNVFENTGMKIGSIYGALAKIAYKSGISVIPTRNLSDTAIVIERIAYREQVKDNATILSRKAPKSMSVEERRTFIVEGFVDIGPKKAKSLIENYETPYQVFKAIKHTKVIYTRTGNPKGIKGPLSDLSGFGWKFVEKNKEMLFGTLKEKGPVQKKIDELLD